MQQFASAKKFHNDTKYTFNDIKEIYRESPPDSKSQPVKSFSQTSEINLPRTFDSGTSDFITDLTQSGEFSRLFQFKEKLLSVETLSTLLYLTNGSTLVKDFGNRKVYLRASPSASACYPVEIYVVVNHIRELDKGIYYFNPIDHKLALIREGSLNENLKQSCFGLSFFDTAPVSFIFTSIFSRNTWKYQDRAFRYSMMEAGYIAENLAVAGHSLGLSVNLIGDFVDTALNDLLNIDPSEELALLVASIGEAAAPLKEEYYEFSHQADSAEAKQEDDKNISVEFYLHSSHFPPDHTDHNVRVQLPHQKDFGAQKLNGNLLTIPEPLKISDISTLDVIESRRSSYNFSRIPIKSAELSAILYYSSQIPAMYDYPAFNIFVLVNAVEDIPSGVYRYDRKNHRLETLRTGTFRGDISYLTLAQDAVFNSGISLFYSASFKDMQLFSNRGYRYAFFNTGMLSEAAYLVANALDLGVRGISNFFDDEINRFFGLNDGEEFILSGVIVGKK